MTTKKSEPYTITRYYREGNFWEWKAGVPFTETAREVHHQAVDGAVEIIFKRPRMRKAETYTVTDTSAITYAVVTQGDVVVYDSRTHVPVAETADMAQLPADVVETLMNATPEEAAAITEAAQQQIAQLTELLTDEVEESETANLPVPADDDAVWDDDAPVHDAEVVGVDDDIDLAGADLGEVAAYTNKWHAIAKERGLSTVAACIKMGHGLIAAKALCKAEKVSFMRWREANTDISHSSANKWMNLADANSYRDTNLDLEPLVRAALAAIGKPAEGNKGGGSNTRTRTRTAHPHRDAMRKAADSMLAIEEALGKLERAMATLVKLGEGGPRGMEKRLGEISTRLLAVEDQAAELPDDDEEVMGVWALAQGNGHWCVDGTFTYHGPGGNLTPDPTLASPVRTWSSRKAAVAARA